MLVVERAGVPQWAGGCAPQCLGALTSSMGRAMRNDSVHGQVHRTLAMRLGVQPGKPSAAQGQGAVGCHAQDEL